MNINDAIVGVVGTAINDGLAIHYGKTATESLHDAEYRWLVENGATPSQLNDMWFELLRANGYTGSINDMLLQFWLNGGVFAFQMSSANVDFQTVTINFSEAAFFADGAAPIGIVITNVTTAETAGIIAHSGNTTNSMEVVVSWVAAPAFGDLFTVEYQGGGFILNGDSDECTIETILCHNVLNIVPVNTVAPEISGTGVVGEVLTCFSTGSWTGQPDTYEYIWSGNGDNGLSTYIPVSADVGSDLTCSVRASNQFGSSAPAASNAIEAAYGAPINTSPPVISGNTSEGSVLSCSVGTWDNPVSTFTYDWQRGGVSTGDTSNTYLVELDDAGADMTCVVTATNAIGSNEATSNTLVMDGGMLVSAVVGDAEPSDIVLTFINTVTATTPALDWTYSVNGGADTAPTAVILGSVLTLTMSAPIVYGDTVTVNYSNTTSDMAIGGVQLEAITNKGVTNNVAGSDLYEPTWIDQFTIQSKDVSGWTELAPSVNSKIVYVDSVSGNDGTALTYDSTDFADPFLPAGELAFATPEAAMLETEVTGEDNWILFKKGQEHIWAARVDFKSGKSNTERHVMAGYGAATTRPILNCTTAWARLSNAGKWRNFIGLDIYRYTHDPDNASYVGSSNKVDAKGLESRGGTAGATSGILIEDCVIRFFQYNISISVDQKTNAKMVSDYILRRSIIRNAIKSSSGTYRALGFRTESSSFMVEECIFYHNGFADLTQNSGSGENHSMYMTNSTDCIVRNNTSIGPAHMHMKHTSQYWVDLEASPPRSRNVSMYGNIGIEGNIGSDFGGNEDEGNRQRFDVFKYQDNTMLYNGFDTQNVSWGAVISDAYNSVIEDSLFIRSGHPTLNNTFACKAEWLQSGNTIQNNKAYLISSVSDANNFVSGSGTTESNNTTIPLDDAGYTDLDRTIETYMTLLGQTATIPAFAAKCIALSKDNWDSDYLTNTVKTWVDEGYELGNPPVLVAPVLTGTFNIPNGTAGDSFNVDVSGLATGGDSPSSWQLTGTPPTNAVISASGVITGVMTEEVVAGDSYGVTASNSGGVSNELLDADGFTGSAAGGGGQELNFNGTDIYLSIPSFSLNSGDTISLTFNSSDQTQTKTFTKASGTSIYARIISNALYLTNSTATIDGNTINNGNNISAYLNGVDHELELTVTATANTQYFGTRDNLAEFFKGIMKNISINKGGNVTTWAIDSGSTSTETPTLDENGIGDITIHNADAGDWS